MANSRTMSPAHAARWRRENRAEVEAMQGYYRDAHARGDLAQAAYYREELEAVGAEVPSLPGTDH
jgi:hypothetical protein